MACSKKILYFGLDPSRYRTADEIIHCPLIETRPLPYEAVKPFFAIPHAHVLFTSRTAVAYYFKYAEAKDKSYLCIGEGTAARLADYGMAAACIAEEACGEGVVALLEKSAWGHILYPHSAKSRPLLPDYLQGKGTPFALYDTFPRKIQLPELDQYDKYVFTSPSTVEAFSRLCRKLPAREKCEAIGPVTQNALNKLFMSTILQPIKHS